MSMKEPKMKKKKGGTCTDDLSNEEDVPPEEELTTFGRIEEIMSRFENFNDTIRRGSKERKEVDQNRLEKLKHQMSKLEDSLSDESQRRIEANIARREYCQSLVQELKDSLQSKAKAKDQEIQKRINTLRGRLDEMRARFQVDYDQIPIEVRRGGQALAQRLKSAMSTFDIETEVRLKAEKDLRDRLAYQEAETKRQFCEDRSIRENAYIQLNANLDTYCQRNERFDESINAKLCQLCTRLNNDIKEEAKTRWREDTELADAMAKYINNLQRSLHAVNSDAT